jgi:hypothetical protein
MAAVTPSTLQPVNGQASVGWFQGTLSRSHSDEPPQGCFFGTMDLLWIQQPNSGFMEGKKKNLF